jgi:hypothetical protein
MNEQEAYIQKLMDSKPKRADFETQDEFEESYGYWMGHQGRTIALYQQHHSKASLPPSKSTAAT